MIKKNPLQINRRDKIGNISIALPINHNWKRYSKNYCKSSCGNSKWSNINKKLDYDFTQYARCGGNTNQYECKQRRGALFTITPVEKQN